MQKIRIIGFNTMLKNGLEMISQQIGFDSVLATTYIGLNSESAKLAHNVIEKLDIIEDLDAAVVGDWMNGVWKDIAAQYGWDKKFPMIEEYIDVFKSEFNDHPEFAEKVKKTIHGLKGLAKRIK